MRGDLLNATSTANLGQHAPSPVIDGAPLNGWQQSPAIYLRRCNTVAAAVISRADAGSCFARLTQRAVPVSGSLDRGFGWSHLGAMPPRSYSIIPLRAPYMPYGGDTMIELWWPSGSDDSLWRVRRFRGWLPSAQILYLVACCLWSTPSTGRDATHVVIYGPDRQPFAIDAAASTCGHIPARFVDLMRGDENDPDVRTSSDPPPGWRSNVGP
jgi:hypothetical protein